MSPDEPEYAYSKGRRAHRIVALFAAAVLIGIVTHYAGVGRGIRYAGSLVFPIAGIWFADELAEHVSNTSSGWINASNAPLVLRVACWFCLACFAFVLFLGIWNA